MGKRNPVTLVSAVVKRKSAVVTGNLSEASIPPTTISPLPIAIRVIATCKIVKAPTDIPRIMEVPVVARSLAEHHFDPNYSRDLRPAESVRKRCCTTAIFRRRCPLWVKSGHRSTSAQCPLYPQKRTSLSAIAVSALPIIRTSRCLPLALYALPRSLRQASSSHSFDVPGDIVGPAAGGEGCNSGQTQRRIEMADTPDVFFCIHHLSGEGMACRSDPQ